MDSKDTANVSYDKMTYSAKITYDNCASCINYKTCCDKDLVFDYMLTDSFYRVRNEELFSTAYNDRKLPVCLPERFEVNISCKDFKLKK